MSRWSIGLVGFVFGGVAGVIIAGSLVKGNNAGPAAIPKEISSYRDVVKHVLPAVVSIEATAKPKAKEDRPRGRLPEDERIPPEFKRFFEEFGGAPLDGIEGSPHLGFGSGFLIDAKGVILTNYHVVAGAEQVTVHLKDGRKIVSKKIHGDRKTDLAIVRIEAKEPLPFLELADSDAMEIGDRVLAVGAPFGLTGSVTAGIVSAKGRAGLNVNMYEDFLQTDAAINPGNSGGPLVNLEGKVIGINAAIKSRNGGFQGVGLAIASNMAKSVLPQLLDGGVVKRGYLGVQITDLTAEVAARVGMKEGAGVVVSQVFEGAPAAKAGIQEGDVITSIAGKPVKDGRELQRVVAGLPLRKPSEIAITRDGKAKTVTVTIEEQPDDLGGKPVRPKEEPKSGK